MAVSLQKGQKVELRKSNGGELREVVAGLGWDPVKRGGLFSRPMADIDCDASAFLCIDGRLQSRDDIVYFGNKTHNSRAVRHSGDNLTGGGDGDDEQIVVDLASLPAKYDKVVFVVNIYKAAERRQHFGMVENCFIRIFDKLTGEELCRYNLSENYDGMTAMIFGELYRHNGVWKFNAIGQATKDNSIPALAERFK